MKFGHHLFLILAVSLIITVGLYAGEEKKAGSASMSFGSRMYLNWHANMTDSDVNGSGNKKNTFQMERLYLHWKYKFDKAFSLKATSDIGNDSIIEGIVDNEQNLDSGETVTSKSGTTTSKYRPYLKYAYLQYKKNVADNINLQLRAGMVNTPISGFIDNLGDQRWIHKNMIMSSKEILKMKSASGAGDGYTIETTADMGLQLQARIMKMFTFISAFTNGEGYKYTSETSMGGRSEGKAYYGRVTFTPVKGLYINGYLRFEVTDTDKFDNHKGYYGGSVAWKDEIIKIGVNYIKPFEEVNGKKLSYIDTVTNIEKNYNMAIIDAWLTVDLKSITGMPILIMSRYGYGHNGLPSGKTNYYGGGLGYRFEKYLRVAAWYQELDNDAEEKANNPNPEKTFFFKAEINI